MQLSKHPRQKEERHLLRKKIVSLFNYTFSHSSLFFIFDKMKILKAPMTTLMMLIATTPMLKSPTLKTPTLKTPMLRTPMLKTPTLRTPMLKTSTLKTPMLKTPMLKTPAMKSQNTRKLMTTLGRARTNKTLSMSTVIQR